jgi:hypothetical protein
MATIFLSMELSPGQLLDWTTLSGMEMNERRRAGRVEGVV